MDENTLKLLEFPKVVKFLSNFCISESGKKKCLSLRPLNNIHTIQKGLSLLREALTYSREIIDLINEFPPLEGIFAYIQKEKVLDEDGLWAIKIFLEKSRKLKEFIEGLEEVSAPTILECFSPMPWPQKTWQALKRCLDQNGEIKDQASPSLMAVRGEIRKIQKQCTKKINDYIADQNISEMLQDEYLTISSDRYVIALKANFKGRIKGIIHDYSQSGETCYFEPMFLVELNNKLQELKNKEREEKNKVLKYLTSLILDEYDKIGKLYFLMVEMDILRAKILFSQEIRGNIIDIADNKVVLKNSRHPLLYLEHKEKIEPVDIILKESQKALILTGGNSGGKTVALKTLGLCALMAYSSLAVPCEEGSFLPFWSKIFVFLGDEQSIQESLSTFTAQIKKLRDIWPRVDGSTLVLLDEFGTGTDPSQGAALAQAVIDSLLNKGSWIFAVTHFPSLKVYALNKENVRAAMVLFDPATKKPLYKIAYDQVGHSQALEVAKEFGMPKEILDKAREYLLINNEETTQIIEKLNTIAVEREKELSILRQKERELEEEKKKLKIKYERKIQELIAHISKAIKEIVTHYREQKLKRKLATKKLKEYREILQKKLTPSSSKTHLSIEELNIGQEILYIPWDKKGLIEAIDNKKSKLKINISGVSIWVSPEEVSFIKKDQEKDSKESIRLSLTSDGLSPFVLDIRGKRVDEAEVLINQFLDKAIYRGISQVEIIHGRGEGILRRYVHEILKDFPNVEGFSFAPEDRGGDGVTLVKLR